jgi:hypothetical protein
MFYFLLLTLSGLAIIPMISSWYNIFKIIIYTQRRWNVRFSLSLYIDTQESSAFVNLNIKSIGYYDLIDWTLAIEKLKIGVCQAFIMYCEQINAIDLSSYKCTRFVFDIHNARHSLCFVMPSNMADLSSVKHVSFNFPFISLYGFVRIFCVCFLNARVQITVEPLITDTAGEFKFCPL